MLAPGALERVVTVLLGQSTGRGAPLAPVLHLHGSAGWKPMAVNVGSPDELEGSLDEARHVCQLEPVDAFVCILRGEHADALAAGLDVGVSAGDGEEIAYAAKTLGGEARESAGLELVGDALAALLFGRS